MARKSNKVRCKPGPAIPTENDLQKQAREAAEGHLCPSVWGAGAAAGAASMQKELAIMMNAKIDHAALNNACMNIFLPKIFTFRTWSKTALHNLLRGIW